MGRGLEVRGPEGAAAVTLALDPEEASRQKQRRDIRANVLEIPLLRLGGFALLSLVALLHNRFVLPHASSRGLAVLVAGVFAYSLLSWLLLYLFYERVRRVSLGVVFLTLDILAWTLVIYFTGGEKSWLFYVMLIRAADQANTSFRRVLAFSHLSVLSYVLLIAYLSLVEHRSIDWPVEAAKTTALYLGNLYISLTARTAEALRQKTTAAIHMARDLIGRLKQQAVELEQARSRAEEASRAKGEFLANVSHEIRTPLNGVIGMTGLLLDTELAPEQRGYAEAVRRSGQTLLALINDILDFSKIEARKLELEIVDFDLRQIVEEVVDLLSEQAFRKELELACSVQTAIPTDVTGDPGRLRQVLTNLVGNAVKFTERGEVVLRVQRVEETEDEVGIRFEVSDTGIGIPPEAHGRLFHSFSQADGSTTRRYGGTGLGLAICKQLVELMGGQIGVHSQVGKGSAFSFTARLGKPARGTAADSRERQDLRGLRALVVDDNETNREILERQLAGWGMHCWLSASGPQALEALRAAVGAGARYDVAILDMQMPGMDGLHLARAIKADPAWAGLPLILLTSLAQGGLRELATAAGVVAWLTKPVRQSQLYDCLASVLAPAAAAPAAASHRSRAEPAVPFRGRVLVAEDNPVNQLVAAMSLEKQGCRVDVVASGIEAVSALRRIPYDLVLMDCQMPEMDGYQATARIREHEGAERRTRIVAITASAMAGDKEKCLAAGMDDYVSKPIGVSALAAMLDRWLPAPAPASIPAAVKAADVPPRPASADPVDPQALEELWQLAPAGFHDLIHRFLQSVPPRIAGLRGAAERSDRPLLLGTSHALLGSCGFVGAFGLSNLFREMETEASAGAPGALLALVDRIEAEFARVQEELERQARMRSA